VCPSVKYPPWSNKHMLKRAFAFLIFTSECWSMICLLSQLALIIEKPFLWIPRSHVSEGGGTPPPPPQAFESSRSRGKCVSCWRDRGHFRHQRYTLKSGFLDRLTAVNTVQIENREYFASSLESDHSLRVFLGQQFTTLGQVWLTSLWCGQYMGEWRRVFNGFLGKRITWHTHPHRAGPGI